MDLNARLLTLEIDSCDLYEIFLHEIMKKIKEENNREILDNVKKGIVLKFDFEDYVKERFKKRTCVKRVRGKEVGEDILKVKIGGKEVLQKDFEDEVLARVRLMRGWLWENMTIEKIGDWRGGEDKDGE